MTAAAESIVGFYTVGNWEEANEKLKEVATILDAGRVVHGTGYPIATPHLLATTLDAWSGEGMGYFMTWYPEGDTYGARKVFGSIRIGK